RGFPEWYRDREVPRRDERRHTDWLTQRELHGAGDLRGDDVADRADSLASMIAQDRHAPCRFASRLADRLAHFARNELAQLFLSRRDRVGPLVEKLGARRSGHRSPPGQRLGRGMHRGVHFVRRPCGYLGDDVVRVGWIDVLDPLIGGTWAPASANEMLESCWSGHRTLGRVTRDA